MIVITENTPEQLIPSLIETTEITEDYRVHQNPGGEEGGLVHISAEICPDVYIKAGSIVMEKAQVRDGAHVGENVIINPESWICRRTFLKNTVIRGGQVIRTSL